MIEKRKKIRRKKFIIVFFSFWKHKKLNVLFTSFFLLNKMFLTKISFFSKFNPFSESGSDPMYVIAFFRLKNFKWPKNVLFKIFHFFSFSLIPFLNPEVIRCYVIAFFRLKNSKWPKNVLFKIFHFFSFSVIPLETMSWHVIT